MMELVTVVGTGQTGDVTFDNKRIDSTIMFEVTDKNCESMTSRIFKLLVYKLAVHYVLLSHRAEDAKNVDAQLYCEKELSAEEHGFTSVLRQWLLGG